jgi:dienelactone hydrolase
MASVTLFHSVLGLRDAERLAADRWRAAGHDVTTPDLFGGATATTLAEGFVLKDRVGWATIANRARDALRDLPPATVLAGVSMGAGVVQAVLPIRPEAAGVLLLHGLAELPRGVRTGVPVQLHVGAADPLFPPDDVAGWRDRVTGAGARTEVFTYPGAGHYFTDAGLEEHDGPAAALTHERVVEFLRDL